MHPIQRFVPLHFYLLHALDLMYDHLRKGKALPPSQVISSTASRGRTAEGTVPPIEVGTHLPPIGGEPPRAGRIVFVIPE
jgi:hydroxybutyrate-dimer hydrolase